MKNKKLLIPFIILMIASLACGLGSRPEAVIEVPEVIVTQQIEPLPVTVEVPQEDPESPAPTAERITVTEEVEIRVELQPMVVSDVWFYTNPDYPTGLYYVFAIENPNPGYIISNAGYQVVVYDSDNRILATSDVTVPSVFPQEKTWYSYYTISIPEGTTAESIEVTAKTDGEPIPYDGTGTPFSSEKVAYYPSEYSSTVTGWVKNNDPDESVGSATVIAVGFDSSGQVVGVGMSSYIGFIPANGSRPVSMYMDTSELPDHVELFTMMEPGWGIFEAGQEGDYLELEAAGVTQDEYNQVGYAFTATNPNEQGLESVQFSAAIVDKDGFILNTTTGYFSYVFPGEMIAYAGWSSVPEDTLVDHVEIFFSPIMDDAYSWWNLDEYGITSNPFTISDISFFPDEWSPKATGFVNNSYSEPLSASVIAVVYDAGGAIIGGGQGYVTDVPGGSSAAVEIYLTYYGDAETIEFYPILQGPPGY